MGKEYELTKDVDDFRRLHERVLPEIIRVTKPGGSICWQVGYHVYRRAVVPLDYLVYELLSKHALTLRNRIIWTYGHGKHDSERFSGRHETILWFTKGDRYKFNLDSVRVPQKYPGKKSYRGPNRGKHSGNPRGKNPSDVWDIPNVKANHGEKTLHPCQFPVGLARRLVLALTDPSDWVLDPFAGSGTTGAAALMEQRRFAGSEIQPEYAAIAEERLRQAASGSLWFRDPDQPVHTPSQNAGVAKKPEHFLWTNERHANGFV